MQLKKLLTSLIPHRHARVSPTALPIERKIPEFEGLTTWLNGDAISAADLRGKIVLVSFWTSSCVNCLRTFPHLNAWHNAYHDKGLVIIGIHTPEFEFEKNEAIIQSTITRYNIPYRIAIDNNLTMWNAYKNHYWPTHYFIDGKGNIRYHHFGEGNYRYSEEVIKTLLRENGSTPSTIVISEKVGPEPNLSHVGSPETYLGFDRMEYLGSPESIKIGKEQHYSTVPEPGKGAYYLDGMWRIEDEYATPTEPGAKIIYQVNASTINIVMDGDGNPHRLSIQLDGHTLTSHDAGTDNHPDNASQVTVTEGRMYTVVNLHGHYEDHLLEIEFHDPGIKIYAFTFG